MITRAATSDDAAAIADIYNQGIAERGATFETEPRDAAERARWLAACGARHPVVVAEIDGAVVGWAAVSEYRPRRCYDGVGEFSVYVDGRQRGRRVGARLVEALVVEARRLGYWKLLSRVFVHNAASRALCRATGFREVGVYEKHANLDGKWIDCVIVERWLGEPDA